MRSRRVVTPESTAARTKLGERNDLGEHSRTKPMLSGPKTQRETGSIKPLFTGGCGAEIYFSGFPTRRRSSGSIKRGRRFSSPTC